MASAQLYWGRMALFLRLLYYIFVEVDWGFVFVDDFCRRCSVGCSKRYQPQSGAEPNRKAQDYCFEALHRIYFEDAWR